MSSIAKSGITKDIVNSAALYVYCKNYSPDTPPDIVYNDWLASCILPPLSLSAAVMMLEKISGYLHVPRVDMEFALQQEHLL